MKFNSQICTTKEQSKRLLALGLKKETADMGLAGDIPIAIEDWKTQDTTLIDSPAWSLHRLIEILDIWYLELNFNEFNNAYEQVISYSEERVKGGFINKDYLKE